MTKTVIYYFSGTGNSFYVAKELRERLPGTELIPLVSLSKQEKIETNAEVVGFVFPIYFTAIPTTVKKVIEKLNLESAQYIFAVVTRSGISHSAFFTLDKILNKKGKRLNACLSLNMASNNPRFKYEAPTEEELAKLESEVNNRLDLIREIIGDRQEYREKDLQATTHIPKIFLRLISAIVGFLDRSNNGFYADTKCTGCGTCEKVCLSEKIKLNDKTPVWQQGIKCYNCCACVNYCPEQAVQMSSNTEKYGRYSHPYATVEDICAQKYQTCRKDL